MQTVYINDSNKHIKQDPDYSPYPFFTEILESDGQVVVAVFLFLTELDPYVNDVNWFLGL